MWDSSDFRKMFWISRKAPNNAISGPSGRSTQADGLPRVYFGSNMVDIQRRDCGDTGHIGQAHSRYFLIMEISLKVGEEAGYVILASDMVVQHVK